MKKIKSLLLLYFFLIVSTVSYAQVYLETFAVAIGEWDIRTEEWDWEPLIYQDITFVLDGDVITVNDLSGSVYVTYAEFTDDKNSTSWKAVDEEGNSCIVGMSKKGHSPFTMYVMYDNFMYKYFFKQ